MILRNELNTFLKELFHPERFQDHCQNGLQVEGKAQIDTIAFGVSLNLPMIERAIQFNANAIIVHHGFFGKEVFSLTGRRREQVRLLLRHDLSLFGMHLPLDAHEQLGNNAELLRYIGAEIGEPFEVGFFARNTQEHSLTAMLDIFHHALHPANYQPAASPAPAPFLLAPTYRHDFLTYPNGPDVPKKLAVLSGSASREYRSNAVFERGVDTFICGSVDESTAAVSHETRTNFINLGHYWSEKPGILALKAEIERNFDVRALFIDIENVV